MYSTYGAGASSSSSSGNSGGFRATGLLACGTSSAVAARVASQGAVLVATAPGHQRSAQAPFSRAILASGRPRALHTLGSLGRPRTCRLRQGTDIRLIQLHPLAPFEPARQNHGAVADPDEATDRVAHGFNHAANLPVAPLGNGDAVPAIGALATAIFNRAELRHAIVQQHAGQQCFLFIGTQGPKNAHGIFPLQAESGVHQLVGQVAGAGEKQQSLGIQVQTPDRLPLALRQFGQATKNRWTDLRIVMGDDLTRSILLQIILEEEASGQPLFSSSMLSQMIRFYGNTMQSMMGSYLEKNLQAFVEIQGRIQEQSRQLYDAKGMPSAELWTQFMSLQAPMVQSMMSNYVDQSKNLFVQMQDQMQQNARSMFTGFPFPGAPGSGEPK